MFEVQTEMNKKGNNYSPQTTYIFTTSFRKALIF